MQQALHAEVDELNKNVEVLTERLTVLQSKHDGVVDECEALKQTIESKDAHLRKVEIEHVSTAVDCHGNA